MFPQSGSGVSNIGPIYRRIDQPIPAHLCPRNESDIKYKIRENLSQCGDCYCEVSLEGGEQIDLVWESTPASGNDKRVIGIEIKTNSALNQATRKLEEQVAKYREKTADDFVGATHVAGDEIMCADEVYVFDELWVVAVGDHDRWDLPWSEGTPDDGWLTYDKYTGDVAYEIDASSRSDTIHLDYEHRAGEAQLTAMLWDRYTSPNTLVAAESWFSKPEDRTISDGRVKYLTGKGQEGKRMNADLTFAKIDDVTPVTPDSTIRAIEVKDSFTSSARSRLRTQLPLYCNSKMFSEVYLAVPDAFRTEAHDFLKAEMPAVGLLSIDQAQEDVSRIRPARQLELQKIPMRRCPGGSPHFAL